MRGGVEKMGKKIFKKSNNANIVRTVSKTMRAGTFP